MSNEDIIRDTPIRFRNEDMPDVEGHIRPTHGMNDVHVGAAEEIRPEALDEDDGPDVEGHIVRF